MTLDEILLLADAYAKHDCEPLRSRTRVTLVAALAQAFAACEPAEHVPYLFYGARFKLNFNTQGNCTTFRMMEHGLQGKWVALVDATDGKHLDASPQPRHQSPDPHGAYESRCRCEDKQYDKDSFIAGYDQGSYDEAMHKGPHQREPLSDQEINDWWSSENGLEDCALCRLIDFTKAVRAVEAKHGIRVAK